MSLGLTPQDFVKKVFYMQEKVLLDFDPNDDVYKEVLTEANMVLEELQKDEDWLWLRKTVPLGFIDQDRGIVPIAHCWYNHLHGHHWHWHHHIQADPTTLEIPKSVYKPSELYGDCVRLCRYYWRRDFIDLFPDMEDHFIHWNEKVKDGVKLSVDEPFVLHGDLNINEIDLTGLKYNATFLVDLQEMDRETILELLPRGTWSLDVNCNLYVSTDDFPRIVVVFDPAQDVECRHHMFDRHRVHCKPWVYHPRCKLEHPLYEQPLGFEKTLDFIVIDEFDSIKVPYVSAGMMYRHNVNQTNRVLMNNMPERTFGCIIQGDKLKFNRPLRWYEHDRVVLMDCQMRIEPFHICDNSCKSIQTLYSGEHYHPDYPINPCVEVLEQERKMMLTEIPDPLYVVAKTAAMHAEGSPPAQAMLQTLNDRAQKLLSSMRSANAEFTNPDVADWAPMEYINVI